MTRSGTPRSSSTRVADPVVSKAGVRPPVRSGRRCLGTALSGWHDCGVLPARWNMTTASMELQRRRPHPPTGHFCANEPKSGTYELGGPVERSRRR